MSTLHDPIVAPHAGGRAHRPRPWSDDGGEFAPSDFMLTRVYAVGMPADRAARIAARRAFVRAKQCTVEATATIPGSLGELLRRKVRQSDDMSDLASMREVILALMPDETVEDHRRRETARREFERVFGERPSAFDTVPR